MQQLAYEALSPFVKWAGGKRQLLPELLKHVPDYQTYFEPFVGGGALLFALQPRKAFINDINSELINCYLVIAEHPLHHLLAEIKTFPIDQDFYYKLREEDRNPDFQQKDKVFRAARFIYLNKTCFNGLYRVNKKGQNNVPWGKYKNPTVLDESVRKVSHYLRTAEVCICNTTWQEIFSIVTPNSFVYLDPPYDVFSQTANFTSYSKLPFGKNEQTELKAGVDELNARGAKVLQSNANTPFIRDLYRDYEITEVQAKRAINSKGNKRGNVSELLIKNY